MKKYPKYKDSGVEWIGEIPNDWKISFVKYLLKKDGFRSGPFGSSLITDLLEESGNYLVYSPEHLTDHNVVNPFYVPQDREEELRKYEVKEGDIVLPIVGTLGRGKLITSDDKKGILNQRLCRISPDSNRVNLELLLIILTDTNLIKVQLDIEKKGSILDHITREIIFNFHFPLQSLPEQNQIVEFLDHKTTIIDDLIQKKQRKIELLREHRTSIINQTVTKGLNPDVKMKDSGVEWIGEIPDGWNSVRMKYLCEMITEKGEASETDIKISPENMESYTGRCFNLYSDYTGEGIRFQKGDVLFNKLRLYLVKILLPDYDGFSMGEMIVLRPRKINSKYLFYTLFNQGLINLLNSQSTGVKLPRVSPEVILNSFLPSPPIPEQHQIVEYLDQKTNEIDTTITIENKKIDLLKEYRQSLISEVVTGKIDVRKN